MGPVTDVVSLPAPEPSGSGAGPDQEDVKAGRELVLGSSGLVAHLVLLAVWLGVTALLAVEAMNYNERARAFAIITFAAMATLILGRAAQVVLGARRYGTGGPPRERFVREAIMFAWLAVAWVLVQLLGLIPGSMLLLASHLLVHRPVSLGRIAIIVVGVYIAVRVLFVELLNLPLESGIIF